MSPTLNNGDRLLVAPINKGENPTAGSIVIISRGNILAAHRILSVNNETVITRGDASGHNDLPVPVHKLLAKVIAVKKQKYER